MIRQFVTFAGVGAVATACQYVVLLCLVELAHMPPVPAAVLGYLAGATVGYTLNRQITFRSGRSHREAALRFGAVATVGLAANALIMQICAEVLGLHYLVAQLAATGIVLIWNFFANRHWTFKEPQLGSDKP
jgi:putative flippase GtrA